MHAPRPIAVRGWSATLALDFESRLGRTVLAARRHDGPLVVQKPLYPEGDAVCHTIIVHPPGGIAGGDALELSARVARDGQVLLTTPGAAKWYRSAGAEATQRITLQADAGAAIEWLPQETIAFRGAIGETAIDIALERTSRYIGWEVLCLGRTGAGERFTEGTFRTRTRVSIGGRLAWHENAIVQADGRLLESPVGLERAPVCGTLLAVGANVDRVLLAALRAVAPKRGAGALSLLPTLAVARYRGDSTEAAREYFVALWRLLRPALLGRDAIEPRIWRT